MDSLLAPDEPIPVEVENPAGASSLIFVSDHAGNVIPRRLGSLGLSAGDRERHIAWDIGIQGVTSRLARVLDAVYVYQRYSRLVIDCNRLPRSEQSIMAVSDGTPIPGNLNLTAEAIDAREREILRPYHDEIGRILDRRRTIGRSSVIFAMHSCTPRIGGEAAARPWHIGVIADRDWRIGEALIAALSQKAELCVGRNKPYSMNPDMDYTLPVHAERRHLPYVEIEIRQDLIGDAAGQQEWATLLAALLPGVVEASGALVP